MTTNPLTFWLGLVLVLLGWAWYDLWRTRRALRALERMQIAAIWARDHVAVMRALWCEPSRWAERN